jgi:hypothetical protein
MMGAPFTAMKMTERKKTSLGTENGVDAIISNQWTSRKERRPQVAT